MLPLLLLLTFRWFVVVENRYRRPRPSSRGELNAREGWTNKQFGEERVVDEADVSCRIHSAPELGVCKAELDRPCCRSLVVRKAPEALFARDVTILPHLECQTRSDLVLRRARQRAGSNSLRCFGYIPGRPGQDLRRTKVLLRIRGGVSSARRGCHPALCRSLWRSDSAFLLPVLLCVLPGPRCPLVSCHFARH